MIFNRLFFTPIIPCGKSLVKALRSSLLQSWSNVAAGIKGYNQKVNGISAFNPDFVFWLQKEDDYFIVFIDPKGTEHTDYQYKVDGYRRIFEEGTGGMRILVHDGLKVRVGLSLYTSDVNLVAKGYRSYWFDSIDGVLARLLSS